MTKPQMEQQKTLIAALVGAPNAGKSTLLNTLVKEKVAIVTPKEQTTRCCVRGIAVEQDTQLVFIDTPGIFLAKTRLHRAMIDAAWQAVEEADVVVCVLDSKRGLDERAQNVLQRIKQLKRPMAVLLNKVDIIEKARLLPLTDSVIKQGWTGELFMVSAREGDGIEALKTWLLKQAKLGPWLFPEDQITDMPSKLMAAEITRETLLFALQQEIPYNVLVETEHWKESKGAITLHQVIYVKRTGHKTIVLGKGGQSIKQIGIKARTEMGKVFGKRVNLYLHVKVKENWEDDAYSYILAGLTPGRD